MTAPTYQLLADRADDAARLLFGLSELAQRLRATTAAMRADCAQLESNRGLNVLSVGLLGPKNHGKSALARMLVRDAAARERIRSGLLARDATTRLLWLGESSPAALDAEREEFLRVELEPIGRSYVVIDVPGFTDADGRARQCARDALASCQLKVLIVERSQLEAEDTQLHLELANGATVLPFVRAKLAPGETGPDEALRLDMEKFAHAIRAAAPRSHLLPVTLLPDIDTFGLGGEEAVRSRLIAALCGAVENLADSQSLVADQIDARVHRWRREMRELLSGVRERVRPALEQLAAEEKRLPAEVLAGFIGSRELLEAGTRMRLRSAMMARLSPLYFPFRPLVALLVFTSGAWDRLIIGMAGSIPSLALAFYAAAKNVRDLRRVRSEARDGLETRVLAALRERVQPVAADFWRAVRGIAGDADTAREPAPAVVSVRLSGLEDLQQQSTRWFENEIAGARANGFFLHLCALAGTAAFWACMTGPLTSIYREFFETAERVFDPHHGVLWSDFPVPSGAMLFTSVLLSVLPMLVIALVCVGFAVTSRRAAHCAERIRETHEREIAARESDGRLRLETGDAAVEAARFLIGL